MKTYRAICRIFIGVFVAAIPLHTVLLASDSEIYRRWVYVQMCLLAMAAISLWVSLKPNWFAACVFGLITIPATYINAVYLNYGNGLIVWIVPFLLLLVFMCTARYARKELAANA